jgi:hypothetical protein|uniref:Uncharacterized protein n=1 Tax=uncultured prokaryote TaxID=198431 RepID=A0A0H5PY94_9ZZZZ|nr:hypothetical protein [uncultured prokaryote]
MKQGYAPTSYKTNMNNHKQSRKAVSADAKQLFLRQSAILCQEHPFLPLVSSMASFPVICSTVISIISK